jgi:hypothetical protein
MEAIRGMSYFFHPEAEKEFLEAIDYYEEREAGLGFDFAVEVYTAIGRAVEHPQTWPIIDGERFACPQKLILGPPDRGPFFFHFVSGLFRASARTNGKIVGYGHENLRKVPIRSLRIWLGNQIFWLGR